MLAGRDTDEDDEGLVIKGPDRGVGPVRRGLGVGFLTVTVEMIGPDDEEGLSPLPLPEPKNDTFQISRGITDRTQRGYEREVGVSGGTRGAEEMRVNWLKYRNQGRLFGSSNSADPRSNRQRMGTMKDA